MKIIIKNKKNRVSGYLSVSHIGNDFKLDLSHQTHPELILDIQKLLDKYYNLSILSGRGDIRSKYLLKKLVENYKTNKWSNASRNRAWKKNLKRNQLNQQEKK